MSQWNKMQADAADKKAKEAKKREDAARRKGQADARQKAEQERKKHEAEAKRQRRFT